MFSWELFQRFILSELKHFRYLASGYSISKSKSFPFIYMRYVMQLVFSEPNCIFSI